MPQVRTQATNAGAIPFAPPVEAFKDAMRHLASSVSLVTAGTGDERRGLTCSAMTSVSMGPPTLLACVNRESEAVKTISKYGSFCVNILGKPDQDVAECFAGRTELKGLDKFKPFQWRDMPSGAPALESALVNIDCALAQTVYMHSHLVFFGTVKTVWRENEQDPLIHYNRQFFTI